MITLKEITKTYESRKGRGYQALKGISFSLPSRGMVFLLGKSGSGKTTLLNLIGLLDRPTTGSIEVDGVCLENNEKIYDSFRNTYSGFVFQEFNLLEKETVEQNVALALQLQDEKDTEKRTKDALSAVGLTGFEKRYPAELSGGEKQRVAIARALVKQSKMILADEPTGNLDSENGEEIFSILKSISGQKLVVVVTHDRDFAERFGDRIIELKDGRVISDTASDVKEESETQAELRTKSHLPTGLALRMGFRNLGKHKIRSIITIIVAFLSITVIAFAQVLCYFTAEHALAANIAKKGVDTIALTQSGRVDDTVSRNPITFRLTDWESKIPSGMTYIKSASGIPENYIVESKEQMAQMGFEFYDGAVELDDNSVYITDYYASKILTKPYEDDKDGDDKIYFNGEEWTYDPAVHTYSDFVGKTYHQTKIAGVVKTEWRDFYDENGRGYDEVQPPYTDEAYYSARQKFLDTYVCRSLFYTKARAKNIADRFYFYSDSDIKYKISANGRRLENLKIDVPTFSSLFAESGRILVKDQPKGLSEKDISLSDDEIIIDLDMYYNLYGKALSIRDYLEEVRIEKYDEQGNVIFSGWEYRVKAFPKELGKAVRLSVARDGKDVIEEREYKIVGIDFSRSVNVEHPINYVLISQKTMSELYNPDYFTTCVLLQLNGAKESQIRNMLIKLRNENWVISDFEYSAPIYDNEQMNLNVGRTCFVFGGIMIVVTVLVMISLISMSIMRQRKEIGILRALGARAVDISKIYFMESGIVSVIVFLLSTLLTVGLVWYNNISFASFTMPGLIISGFTWGTWLVLIAASLVAINLATLLPIGKIAKQKPSDEMKR